MKNKNPNNQATATLSSGRRQISSEELEQRYADMLDKQYPVFKCCGIEYAASATLSLIDETAYDQGLDEYIASGWKEHPSRSGFYIPKTS